MKTIYLLSTEHLEDSLWFRDEEDFKVAMNHIAIEAALHPEVIILAFILMSNHLHFVLYCTEEDAAAFINRLKQRYSVYYQCKYGINELLRRNGFDIKLIPMEDEAPERAIAYVMMNCVAANVCSFCNQYPWGTGNVFFNQLPEEGRRVEEMSSRRLQKMLHSDCTDLPGNWTIGNNGYIQPHHYVAVKSVEAIFHSPKRMNYFLNSSSKARRRLEYADDKLPAFRDQVILASITDLCRSLFQKETFTQLSSEEQTELLRQIRFRFNSDTNQIARVCGLTYAAAARLLDTV